MSPARWRQVEEALDQVLDAAPSARAAVLYRLGQADPALRDEVEELLRAHDAAGSYLEGPANEFAASLLAEEETAETAMYAPEAVTQAVDRSAKPSYASPSQAPEPTVRRTSTSAPSTSAPSAADSSARSRRGLFFTLAGLVVVAVTAWGIVRYVAAPPIASYGKQLLDDVAPLFGEPVAGHLSVRETLTRGASLADDPAADEPARARLAAMQSGLAISLGRYALADTTSQQALVTWRRIEPTGGPNHADALALRAHLAYALGDTSGAERRYRQVLAIRRATLPEDHPDLAASLNDLGVVLRRQDAAEAAALLDEALRLRREHYGTAHPYVANTLSNLATLHHDAGRLEEAERLYREALDIYEQTAGSAHPRAVTIRANLANVLHDAGAFEQARALYLQVIEQCRQLYGERHPQLGRVLYNLAVLEHEHELLNPADVHYRAALDVLRATLPPEHPQLQHVRTAYAHLLRVTGRPREATSLLAGSA